MSDSGCGAGLATQAEQAVLPGRQAEAWQAQRIDLLLGQVWRQLLIDSNACGELTARRIGVSARTAAHVAVTSAYDVVADVLARVDVYRAAGLDNGGIALVAG